MCLLILIHGVDPAFPLIVAGNRDERRSRKSSPPGLFIGESRRMLSPRDREAAGTWLAVNEAGMFAGITNQPGAGVAVSTTRGELPHLALDQPDLETAVRAVEARCAEAPFAPFQLVLADPSAAVILSNRSGRVARKDVAGTPLTVLTNEHRAGELVLPQAQELVRADLSLTDRLAALRVVLGDEGTTSGHRILKKGGDYGTVSSSLIAIPAAGVAELQWWYAAGEPDTTEYRNYGNLARRLA